MRIWRLAGVAVTIAALCFVFVPKAGAAVFDQRTILTFSGPVAIPDRVLDPGSYVFKVVLVHGDRSIVQVQNRDEIGVIGSYITVTKYRPEPTANVVVTFKEMPAGSPATIDAWWYPGYIDGHQFIYPESTAVGLANVENESAPMAEGPAPAVTSPPQEESTVAMETAPATVEEPKEEPNVEEQPMSQPAETSLPATASSVPLVGLIGLISLAAAFGFLIVTRRVG
jgi:hypothetical protein